MVEFLYSGDYKCERSVNGKTHVVASRQLVHANCPQPETAKKDTTTKDSKDESRDSKYDGDKQVSHDHMAADVALKKKDNAEYLLCQVWMNSIADYYNIPKLAKLSCSKADYELKQNWDSDACCSAIEASRELTLDETFQDVLAAGIASHVNICSRDGHLDRVMDTFSKRVLQALMVEIDNHEKSRALYDQRQDQRIQQAEKEVASLKWWKPAYETKLQDSENELSRCVDLVNNTNVCRNISCKQLFPWYFERENSGIGSRHTLRCKKCSCKH